MVTNQGNKGERKREREREREKKKNERTQKILNRNHSGFIFPTDNFTRFPMKLFPYSWLVNCTDTHCFPSSAKPHYISSLDVITISWRGGVQREAEQSRARRWWRQSRSESGGRERRAEETMTTCDGM